MKEAWALQHAKTHFSELVEAALQEGPQTVTRRGQNTVVILSHGDYLRLTQANTSLDAALSGAPEELIFVRDPSPVPAVDLE